MMNEKFKQILDDDEVVTMSFNPNGKKVMIANILIMVPSLLIACGMIALALFVPEEGFEPAKPIYALIPAGVFLLGIVVTILFTNLWLKKTTYALTSKRVIIRTGIVGVDFKSLDLKSIGATEVYVSFFDKILGGKTGSIRFGSMSTPINGSNSTPYTFSSILEPYKNYKIIKEHIEKVKA